MQKRVGAFGFILSMLSLAFGVSAQDRLPVIDMHLHSYDDSSYFVAPDQRGEMAPPSASAHFDATYASLREHNIVLGVVSGSTSSEEDWLARDADGRLLRGFSSSNLGDWNPEAFEALAREGGVDVFGEIGAFYRGMTLADPLFDPYLKICEEYGIPVAYHTGGGPPGITYRGAPNARVDHGNPLHIEDVLVKYPKLKIYLMHAGEAFYEEAARLMMGYSQVYADLGVVLWAHPATQYYGEEFLRRAKRFGILDRVMFGSDQMVWPHAIKDSIDHLESLDFLAEQDRRDILYNNAARFLGLTEEQIAEHHQ